ncbi:U3 small nucleolar ribonucleoprotein protein MPP10-like, partial [Oppia nitens]|uniref:U3 small nucleolar ribonucleoprotein protein MPP10-like n=1 Tax=Oppia nitens TaxID=1686743 RepID=UPI0023DADB06
MDSNKSVDNYMNVFNESIDKFNEFCAQNDSFLTKDSQKSQQFIDLTKVLFDLNKRLLKDNHLKTRELNVKQSLDQLFTKDFDSEQIWQQIELQNEPILNRLVKQVAKVTVSSRTGGLTFFVDTQTDDKPIDVNVNNGTNDESFDAIVDDKHLFTDESDDESDKNEVSDEDNDATAIDNHKSTIVAKKSAPKSIVDDKFFKLYELEEFLNKEDMKESLKDNNNKEVMSEEENSDDEDIDYFNDSDNEKEEEELGGKDAMFSDFFDAPLNDKKDENSREHDMDEEEEDNEDEEMSGEEFDTRDIDPKDLKAFNDKPVDITLDESDSSDGEDQPYKQNNENDSKSEFERFQQSLSDKIDKHQRINMMEKSWQMKGEISADKRPENSLLEEHLHFDQTTRPMPLITEETTTKLEDIVKQRIKDNAFDDVMRKTKPKQTPFEYRRRITMESEKSKQSLSQVYENEYLKQTQKDKEEQENPDHKEIRKWMRNLFVKLDALSNFHFTPRPVKPEVKIINNLPAITVEEPTPITVSEVSLLAPQEVFNNQKRELQSKDEKSVTDRKRDRRHKKTTQHKKAKYNESKQNGLKSTSKVKISDKSEDSKALSSSKKFFERLQEKTNKQINNKMNFEKNKSKNII